MDCHSHVSRRSRTEYYAVFLKRSSGGCKADELNRRIGVTTGTLDNRAADGPGAVVHDLKWRAQNRSFVAWARLAEKRNTPYVTMILKAIDLLTASDLAASPIWRYTNRDGVHELFVTSITTIPVENLNGKVIGSQVHLANGSERWSLIGNVDATNPRFTEHYLTLSLERDGKWFHLARYHDHDYAERGPEALSRFLGLKIDDVFPIAYDLRIYVEGDLAALVGEVPRKPRQKLSRAELVALAVP